MGTVVGIVIILIALSFWRHVLPGLLGAFIFGLIGSIFGETGRAIGVILGFLSGISAQNDTNKEKDLRNAASQESNSKIKTEHQNQSEPEYESNSEAQIIRCPSCRQKIRVKLPLRTNRVKCSGCSTRFDLWVDVSGQLRIEAVETKKQSSYSSESSSSLIELYRTLGLEPFATPDEVRAAYKKKIREYHPDKVAGLGDKLKEVAETESKAINTAYSMLKEADRAA